MCGSIFIVFLGFGLLCKCGLNYYRSLLIALLCQFVAFQLPNIDPSIRFILEWYVPILIMVVTVFKEASFGVAAKGLFAILSGLLTLLSFWDYEMASSISLPSIPSSHTSIKETSTRSENSGLNWSISPALPLESHLKESDGQDDPNNPLNLNSDAWEPLVSQEGEFSVLSPLPAATQHSTKMLQSYELSFTSTRIKDILPGLYYVVLTTEYPSNFPLPSAQVQATTALNHLASSYQYDTQVETKPIEQNGHNGLAFHLKRSGTGDHLIGLVFPIQNKLYQVLAFTSGDKESEVLAQKFLLSFKPTIKASSPKPTSVPVYNAPKQPIYSTDDL